MLKTITGAKNPGTGPDDRVAISMVPIFTPSRASRSLPREEAWYARTSMSPLVWLSTIRLNMSTAITVRLSGLFGPAFATLSVYFAAAQDNCPSTRTRLAPTSTHTASSQNLFIALLRPSRKTAIQDETPRLPMPARDVRMWRERRRMFRSDGPCQEESTPCAAPARPLGRDLGARARLLRLWQNPYCSV